MSNTLMSQSSNFGMSTVMLHKAYGKNAEKSLAAIGSEAVRLESMLSRFISSSEIGRINESAGLKCERLSDDTYEVLSKAYEFSSCSQGLFDVTIGPLTALWNRDKEKGKVPKDIGIKQALSLVDYTDLLLNPYERTARLKSIGQSIDLGGIGKGYAGDKFIEIYREHGVESAYTNIGGNVVALGTKPDGSSWRVGIQHPRKENSLIGLVSVADKAVVTSGDYQRYFIGSNGKRYHHILDPTTGYPAESGLISVTVVAESSMTADALSTILFLAGIRRGVKLLELFDGIEAIFIDMELQIHVSAGLKECFQAADGVNVNILSERRRSII
ncbi:MAG: FAD:protein FMN transferase [Bacillota bacterium]